MQLSKKILDLLRSNKDLILPTQDQLSYPEKVLQFGTGVLLRGLPDQIIDDANRKGIFCGRIAVVKSTSKGSTDSYENQDGLYTVCFKGIEGENLIDRSVVNASISRVIQASTQWSDIIKLAESTDLEIIISNTTEVGIVASDDDIHKQGAPDSFPGKLLAVLYHRFMHFKGDTDKGLVIVPTELIDDNGSKLKAVVLDLAAHNKLSSEFIQWVVQYNFFCNSLVDRIVPGKMNPNLQHEQENKLGYTDELMIMSEPFGLWAIEASSSIPIDKLSFAQIDNTCVVVPSIRKFKEIKLRLLNGTHTFSCGVALLSGCTYVKDAMQDPDLSKYIRSLLLNEIVPLVQDHEISREELIAFANRVLDRFSNPFLEHKWESISAQFSSKMRMRNLPLILKRLDQNSELSNGILIGLASFMICMRLQKEEELFYFKNAETSFPFTDSQAERFVRHWNNNNTKSVGSSILSDIDIWGIDLSKQGNLVDQLTGKIDQILKKGIRAVL
jgi:tagaturonate reductase